ncbi:DUF4376 domain-containing protein [Pyruvatibacter sp.]
MSEAMIYLERPISVEGHEVLYSELHAAGHDPVRVGLFLVDGQHTTRFPETLRDAVDGILNADGFAAKVLEVRKAQMRRDITATRDAAMAAGFTTDLADGSTITLQTRDQDRPHWLSALALYQAAISAGDGSVQGATIRDSADESHVLTYAEAAMVIVGMGLHGASIMADSWKAKDAVTNAASLADLDAISTLDPTSWAAL